MPVSPRGGNGRGVGGRAGAGAGRAGTPCFLFTRLVSLLVSFVFSHFITILYYIVDS